MSIFTSIEKTRLKSNTFDLSHDRKFSGKMGNLTPIFIADTVPGDKFEIESAAMVRFAPLIAPIMHKVNVYFHYFFVPNRIIWRDWEDFITGGEDGNDSTSWPYVRTNMARAVATHDIGSLLDYLGLPTNADVDSGNGTPVRRFSVLPFAAYQKIWWEYYRDQNLQDNLLNFDVIAGDNTSNFDNYFGLLRKRAWQHDYFTSSLPFVQKGPEAMIPLGTEADIIAKSASDIYSNGFEQIIRTQTGAQAAADRAFGQRSGAGDETGFADVTGRIANDGYLDLNASHIADLSTATAATINELRRAMQLQVWLEKNARGGSRYVESIAVHFGVQSSDGRLQRPEYLGGFSSPINISEILNTSGSQDNPEEVYQPQGTMAGHALAMGAGERVAHYSEEHGYIIGLMSVMPKTAYQQGIPRHFLRRDKFDYFWPEFQHVGEQAVYQDEIYIEGVLEDSSEVFGYNPRYSEYKYINDSVHGEFKTTLDHWHLGRKFASKPMLNADFIECDYNEFDRIFAVNDESDHLWCHVLNKVKATRKMAYFGNPKF